MEGCLPFWTPDPTESVTLGPATTGISWATQLWEQVWSCTSLQAVLQHLCSLLFSLLGFTQDHWVLSVSLQGVPQSQELHEAAGSNGALLQMRN